MVYFPNWHVTLALSLWLVLGYGCGGDDNAGIINPSNPPVATPSSDPVPPPDPPELVPPTGSAGSNVIINEVFPETSLIELYNPTTAPANISGYWLCHTTPALVYDRIPDNTTIKAGGFLIVHWGTTGTSTEKDLFTTPAAPLPLNKPHGELGLYTDFGFDEANFAISEFLQAYVQWGKGDHWRERVAIGAELWPDGAFVPTPSPEQSISFAGDGDPPDTWTVTTPTIGSVNILP